MTLISNLGFQPQKKANFTAPVLIQASDISIVIPIRNNQAGIERFLAEFLKTQPPELYPREILIVDNHSTPEITIPQQLYALPVRLLNCSKIGPAAARNVGIQSATGEWILFTDSDCIPSQSFISGYLEAMNGSLGYAGNVKAWGNDYLSRYYQSQEILVPLKVIEATGKMRPEYLITANALVWKKALKFIGGFDETIRIAAGEDIDLGFRLLEIGNLSYAFNSVIYHNFEDGFRGFVSRFIRYGKGNRIVNRKYGIDLMPKPFRAACHNSLNQHLAALQYICLVWGYVTY